MVPQGSQSQSAAEGSKYTKFLPFALRQMLTTGCQPSALNSGFNWCRDYLHWPPPATEDYSYATIPQMCSNRSTTPVPIQHQKGRRTLSGPQDAGVALTSAHQTQRHGRLCALSPTVFPRVFWEKLPGKNHAKPLVPFGFLRMTDLCRDACKSQTDESG